MNKDIEKKLCVSGYVLLGIIFSPVFILAGLMSRLIWLFQGLPGNECQNCGSKYTEIHNNKSAVTERGGAFGLLIDRDIICVRCKHVTHQLEFHTIDEPSYEGC